jgi:hypothetical protein
VERQDVLGSFYYHWSRSDKKLTLNKSLKTSTYKGKEEGLDMQNYVLHDNNKLSLVGAKEDFTDWLLLNLISRSQIS